MNIYYKDRLPTETISLSSDFFLKKNILITEEWHESVPGLYSVTISIDGTGFSTNGKGISKELALASAHGELQERLLNNAFFRINSDIYYNCERLNPIKEKKICNYTNAEIPIEKIYEAISPDSINNIEIFKDFNGKALMMPFEMADLCFGTNGMCAGNSEDEAITQGLSEILERFVCKKIIDETIKPRSINIANENGLKHVHKIVDCLKKKNIDVYFYDLSGDYNIPAIGSLFVNKKECGYFFKIGVHPNLIVAIERTLTEFAQGKTLDNISKLVHYDDLIHVDSKDDVLLRYFIDGNAPFPIKPFIKCESGLLQNKLFLNNHEFRSFLESIINKLGFNIYYEDNSSDIFSAYRIIVPGMSEIIDKNHFFGIHTIRHERELIKEILKTSLLTKDSVSSLYEIVKRNNWLKELVISKCSFIDIAVANKTIVSFKFYEMIMFLFLNLHEYKQAYDLGLQFINRNSDKVSQCLMMYLKYICETNCIFTKKEEFEQICNIFFDKQVISVVYSFLFDTESILKVSVNEDKDLVFQNRKALFKKINNGNA